MKAETFEQKLADTVNEKLNDGTVEKLVDKYIEKGVSDALQGLFSYSGEGRDLIEKKLKEIIVPAIERHDFNKYLIKLDAVLAEIVNRTSIEDNKKILENFKGLMKEPEAKEINLSEIFKMYCEHVAANVNPSGLKACCDDGEPYYEHVTASMDVEHEDKGWFKSSFDDCTVMFTCKEDEYLNFQIRLYKLKTDKKWTIRDGNGSIDINALWKMSRLEVFLSVLERGFVKIILDAEYGFYDDIEPEETPEWSLA